MVEDFKRKGEVYWRRKLTPEQYAVVRERITEAPWTGLYLENQDPGTYKCVGCDQDVFLSETKYDSNCGWPSFYDVADSGSVVLSPDDSHGVGRTEVACSNCGAHLGHLFDDGLAEHGGQRYCINSLSLIFKKKA
jgi:peptide-methionine (R)-S-oxide reductase